MTERAILAGGCFWGMQDLIRKIPGVTNSRVGYTGGHTNAPNYTTVKTGSSGHAEAIEIDFNPQIISYRQILEFFFQIHDPTTKDRQGNDRGSQYRSAIFYTNDEQRLTAIAFINDLNAAGIWKNPISTEVIAASEFYEAEDFHQDYLEKNPGGYTCHFVRPNWSLKQSA